MIKPVKWKTRLELLSADEVRAIHEASLRIMERTGLEMPLSKERQAQARDLGLIVDADTRGYLSLDGSGTDVLDLETGEVRPSTKADLEAAARVSDALPQSSKHVQAMTAVDALNARGTVEIAAEVAGGRDSRHRPAQSFHESQTYPSSHARGLAALGD